MFGSMVGLLCRLRRAGGHDDFALLEIVAHVIVARAIRGGEQEGEALGRACAFRFVALPVDEDLRPARIEFDPADDAAGLERYAQASRVSEAADHGVAVVRLEMIDGRGHVRLSRPQMWRDNQ